LKNCNSDEDDVQDLKLFEQDKQIRMDIINQQDPNLILENQKENKKDIKNIENNFDQSNSSHEIKLDSLEDRIKSTGMIYSLDEGQIETIDKDSKINFNNRIFQETRFGSKTESCIYTKRSSSTNQITTHQASKNFETNETILSSNSQIKSQTQLEISMKNRNKPKTSKEILQEIARLTNGTTPSYLLKSNKDKFDLSFK
jgi:hypothetical protein